MLDTQISFLYLVSHASLPVQAVLSVLLLLSVFSWMFIIQRNQLLNRALKSFEEFENTFWSGTDLLKIYEVLSKQTKALSGERRIFYTGFKEFIRLNKENIAPNAIVECVSRTMDTTIQKEHALLEKHLPFLATVGSVSPYIGLFGTVWGIMMAFQSLGSVHQASLAMVAPGISEALVATAMGLFAAIPAVMAYNRSLNRLNSLMNSYEIFSDEFLSVLHRKAYQMKPNLNEA